ncbi:hypothetical protein OS493_001803 [Desmophyllum pertusum]|uniref:Uncharacterized protein n=1 Tax=Desmophyllum pertusum TaxID=174260 RepID=A0A9X0CTK3_9CNID|nr:hypothetical protein OS493_001803 [Desmophyllum pertusum]
MNVRCVTNSTRYPYSKDIAQDQNDYQNDDIEPAQGKSVVANDVQWIETDIVGPYGFTKDKKKSSLYEWPLDMFLVTKILYEQSGYKLTPCVKTADKKYEIPDSGVCFPPPYGSTTCTSDYDVGLIGRDAGFLTRKFNDYFQAPTPNGFGKPSEVVFDTNIYAFTLEFALPFMFLKLPQTFISGVEVKEGLIDFKMQEVASAYYKVFKYDEYNFFDTLVTGAKNAMGKSVQLDKLKLLAGYIPNFAS